MHPGGNGTVADYTLQVQNESVQLDEILVNGFPFNDVRFMPANTSLTASCSTNQSGHTQCPAANETITATVTVPDTWSSGTYQGDVVFVFQTASAMSRPITVTVPSVRTWTIADTQFQDTVDTGQAGDLGNITVRNTGNEGAELRVNASGNLTQFYDDLPTTIATNPGRNRTTTLQYSIPEDTPFGTYTGAINLTGPQNQTRTINLSVQVQDEMPPTFKQPVTVDDIMATTDRHVTAVVSDNLAVASVNATVYREERVQRGNDSVLMNQTVDTYQLSHQQYSDVWQFTYDATETRGQYYISVTARDTAGNTVSSADAFEVTTLDAVEILDGNFLFDSIRFDESGSHPVIENEVESPFTVRLQSFTYAGNKTPQVGIRGPGDASPEVFDEDREALTFSETGTYEVVVTPQGRESASGSYRFNGRLGIEVPQQHTNISNITFRGSIDSDDYPRGSFISLREFDGYIGYNDALEKFETRYGEIGMGPSKQFVYYIGRINASQCRGANGWFQCTDVTLGEYQDIEDENEQLRRQNQKLSSILYLGSLILVMFSFVGYKTYKYRHLLRGRMPRKHPSYT